MANSKDFAGKTVIVTGGGYGIGKQIALGFAEGGANVVLAARSVDKMESVAGELRAMGTRPLVVSMDAAQETQCQAMVTRALEEYGRIDVLVNNSGIAGPTALARDITGDQWRECIDINLNGAFYCSKYTSQAMIEQKDGSIINVSSIAGRIGYPMRTPYAASKWGMIGLSHSLAAELGPHGIRVNVICPGPIQGERIDRVASARSEATGKSVEQVREDWLDTIPLRRMPSESEVTEAVLFLASDKASGISGQAFNVDGGLRMQ